MTTEEFLNQLLPLLQQKLNEQPKENVLDGLIRPAKPNRITLVPAHGANKAGTTPIQATAKEVISFPRLDNRLSSVSIKNLLRNNDGGILRPQQIDTEFLSFFPTEATQNISKNTVALLKVPFADKLRLIAYAHEPQCG